MTGVSIIVMIGLLAYIAEQEVKDIFAKRERERRFETMLKQGYKSLAACKCRQDYANVLGGWVRRLMWEFSDSQEHIDKTNALLNAILDKHTKTFNHSKI